MFVEVQQKLFKNKMDRKRAEYESAKHYVLNEIEKGHSQDLVIRYLSGKARVEQSSDVYSVIGVLVINIVWQIIFTTLSINRTFDDFPSDASSVLTILSFSISILFILVSSGWLMIAYHSNRIERERHLYREQILRELGLIRGI